MNDIQMNNVLFLCKIFFKLLFKYEARDMSKSKTKIVSLHILYIIKRRRKTFLKSQEEPNVLQPLVEQDGVALCFPSPCSRHGQDTSGES